MCGAEAEILPALPFLQQPDCLQNFQILAIPGGFAYGDDILAGRVFGLELAHRAGEAVLQHLDRGGLVLGICNGFQILVQMGLLPGLQEPLGQVEVTLAANDCNVYQDRWVRLRVSASPCVFLDGEEELYLPLAHAEGKLVPRDAQVLSSMQENQRVALRYIGPDGDQQPDFPHNPNGSIDHIAGLTDTTGQILGLMPHPERHMFPFQHPTWTRAGLQEVADGLRLFQNACRALS
jgi:phosphoribosylformylglycinamidine synthase